MKISRDFFFCFFFCFEKRDIIILKNMRASIHLRPKETGKNKTAIAVVTRLSTTRKPKEKIRRKK